MQFAGSSDAYFSIDYSNNISQFDGLKPLTIEGWFYPTQFANRMQLYYIGNYPLSGSASKIQLENSSANNLGMTLNGWNHVSTSMDGTTVRTFVNGTLVLSASQTSFTGNSGLRNYWGWRLDSFASNFYGYMTDLRVYNNFCKYTSNFTPPTQIYLT